MSNGQVHIYMVFAELSIDGHIEVAASSPEEALDRLDPLSYDQLLTKLRKFGHGKPRKHIRTVGPAHEMCPACEGDGTTVEGAECSKCRGEGYIE